MIKVGQKVRFDPVKSIKEVDRIPRREAIGTVVYINNRNKWFSVEYDCHGVKQRTSFKFSQIGQDVMLCGRKKDVHTKDN